MAAKKPSFRLICRASNDAATNMAIDEAILEAHLNLLIPPTLRLYQFSPPAVSLGYAQNVDNSVQKKIQTSGFDIVRRPTGGRAVLHFGDLTYAFICSSKGTPIAEYNLVSESISTAYKQISQALIFALEALGIQITLGRSINDYRDKQDCFSATTMADLLYKGNKLIGSAQLRRKHSVLQHGSIILNQPQTLMYELFNDGTSNANRHANLCEILNYENPIAVLEKQLLNGFQQTFDCRFLLQELTSYELGLVNKLKSKYRNLAEQPVSQ